MPPFINLGNSAYIYILEVFIIYGNKIIPIIQHKSIAIKVFLCYNRNNMKIGIIKVEKMQNY